MIVLGAKWRLHGDVFYKVDIPKIDKQVNPVGSDGIRLLQGLHLVWARRIYYSKCSWNVKCARSTNRHVNMGHYGCLVSTINQRGINGINRTKRNYLERLSTKDGVISALAFDQRGALKTLDGQISRHRTTVAQMEELKVLRRMN